MAYLKDYKDYIKNQKIVISSPESGKETRKGRIVKSMQEAIRLLHGER